MQNGPGHNGCRCGFVKHVKNIEQQTFKNFLKTVESEKPFQSHFTEISLPWCLILNNAPFVHDEVLKQKEVIGQYSCAYQQKTKIKPNSASY